MNLPFQNIDVDIEKPKENIETLERRVNVNKTFLTLLLIIIVIIIIVIIVMLFL